MRFLCQSTAFLYTSAMISDRSNAEITPSTLVFTAVTQNTAIAENHGTRPKVTMIVNMRLSYCTTLLYVTISVRAYTSASLVSNGLRSIIPYFRFIRFATINKLQTWQCSLYVVCRQMTMRLLRMMFLSWFCILQLNDFSLFYSFKPYIVLLILLRVLRIRSK